MSGYDKLKSARFDAETLGLRALAYVIGDPDLGPRFLSVTGLDVETLRTRAGDPALLGATLSFLDQHEPNLLACAEALDVRPEELVAAGRALEDR